MRRRPYPKYYSTVMRLEQELFHNAHNLLVDSCILYQAKSYPTALAVGVLAFEEIGKLHFLDHVGFEAHLSPHQERKERMQWLFSNQGIFNHVLKQRWALSETGRSFSGQYHGGRLDRLKQDAFYVDFRNGRIRKPDRIAAATAYHQIKRTLEVLKRTHDLPFYGAFEESTRSTRRLANGYIASAEAAFASLPHPRLIRRKRVR
jgi:AbiV family abortive infection protein